MHVNTRLIHNGIIVALQSQEHALQPKWSVTEGLSLDGYERFVVTFNCHRTTVQKLIQPGQGKRNSQELLFNL